MNDVMEDGSITKKRNKKCPETYLPQDRLLDIVDDARKPYLVLSHRPIIGFL